MRKIEPERIKRAARIYASNQEASRALVIRPGQFQPALPALQNRDPYARKRRRREEFYRQRDGDLLEISTSTCKRSRRLEEVHRPQLNRHRISHSVSGELVDFSSANSPLFCSNPRTDLY